MQRPQRVPWSSNLSLQAASQTATLRPSNQQRHVAARQHAPRSPCAAWSQWLLICVSCVRPTCKPWTYTMLLWLGLCLCFPPRKQTMHCLVQFLFPTGLQHIATFVRVTYSFSCLQQASHCIAFCNVCLSLCRTSLREPVSACEKAQQCTPPPREQLHYHTQANPKQTASNQII